MLNDYEKSISILGEWRMFDMKGIEPMFNTPDLHRITREWQLRQLAASGKRAVTVEYYYELEFDLGVITKFVRQYTYEQIEYSLSATMIGFYNMYNAKDLTSMFLFDMGLLGEYGETHGHP